jgi:hypothetical protein
VNTTTTRQARGEALREKVRRMVRGRGRRTDAPRVARTRRRDSSGTPSAWREPLLALLAYAELDVLEYPDERARVQAVRSALCARFDRQPPAALDLRDLAFTIGLIATALGGELPDHGLLSRFLRLLSPSALAEFERAKGFVRVSPN